MSKERVLRVGVMMLLVGCGGAVGEGVPVEEEALASSREALTPCPTVSGSFTASGNSLNDLDANWASKNPIVRVIGSGNTLTFIARNGESGTLTLSGATVSGAFNDPDIAQSGLQGVYAPGTSWVRMDGGRTTYSYYLTFTGATAQASFMFLQPILNFSSYAISVTGSGRVITFKDVWGATATLTLSGPAGCTP
ncbi:hypothetical protein [Vitiosangium sp. GDMCC 1.1324]|uniref:hypothetical protein n=1 Tax=Vitiosangium sp. (strain GDMCC 1.1324) TaxID=2138576 RepID=UPI000D37A0A8|nr:hypothetical protein [Vitiosangium sp. GDMCC 1.1324]PTL78507.1 hypothetical protein DAT35_38940 [Vitiosangium sp. GDMCC 1.1324]